MIETEVIVHDGNFCCLIDLFVCQLCLADLV